LFSNVFAINFTLVNKHYEGGNFPFIQNAYNHKTHLHFMLYYHTLNRNYQLHKMHISIIPTCTAVCWWATNSRTHKFETFYHNFVMTFNHN